MLPDDLEKSIDLANKATQFLRSIGFDPARIGQSVDRNIQQIVERYKKKRRSQAEPIQLSEAEAVHFVFNACKASDRDLQEMFANLLSRAADPEQRAYRTQQDTQTLGFFTAAPHAAGVLCALVGRWPDGCEVSIHNLKRILPEHIAEDAIQDALDVLVQTRCMSVSDSNFQSGDSLTAEQGNLRSGQIFVKLNNEEFRVTALGRRIVELYGPVRSDDSPRSTEPSRAGTAQAD